MSLHADRAGKPIRAVADGVSPICDAHVHLWDIEHHCYPWLQPDQPEGPFGKTARIRRNYLLEDYLRDAEGLGVSALIHVEAGWDPKDPLGEIQWIQSLAHANGIVRGHVAHIDLATPDVGELLEAHSRFSVFCGVRDRLQKGDFTKSYGTQTNLDNPHWLAGMAHLDEGRLAFDLQATAPLAGQCANLAKTYRNVRFVATHSVYPPDRDDGKAYEEWREALSILADCPNMSVKLSGLALATRGWRPDQAHEAFDALLDAFGIERLIAASNFSVDRLFVPLAKIFESYRSWIAAFPAEARRAILFENACRVYGIKV